MTCTAMIPNLDAALELKNLGFWAHAVYPKGHKRKDGSITTGKEPIGKAWGLAQWDQGKLRRTFRDYPAAGVGVALGPGRAPGGDWLADLEGDGPEAAGSLETLCGGEVVDTLGWLSARGGHNLFTVDGDRLLSLLQAAGAEEGEGTKAGVWHLDELPGLEFRIGGLKPNGAVKQVHSACPPTVGDDGKPREWTGGKEIAALPEAAYAYLGAIGERNRMIADVEALEEPAAAVGAHGSNGVAHTVAGDGFKIVAAESSREKYGRAALQGEVEAFSNTQPNGRHAYLLRATLKLAGLVKAGAIVEQDALAGLRDGARSNRMGEARLHEVDEAWRSAMVMANARNIPTGNAGTKPAPSQAASQPAAGDPPDYTALSDEEMGIIRAGSVQERPIDWLWPYRFASGEMALLAGDGGLGKSSLLLAIAALITRGAEWPDKSGRAPVGNVIIVSAEDSKETTLKPRLMALGADLDRVVFVTARMTIKKAGKPSMVNPMTLQDCGYWRDILRRFPGCKMLIVDPIPSYLGRGVNDSKNSELRAVIEPFIETVIRPAGVCFSANSHLNKTLDSKTPIHRIMGSMAYGALPRNVHFVLRDPDKPDRRLFKQAKCNNAPDDLPAVAYSLVKAMIPSAAGEIETAFPQFETETVQVDLQEAMGSRRGKPGPVAQKTPHVALWLLAYLRGAAGPVQLRDVFAAAGDKGLIGEFKINTEGKARWSGAAILYRAKDEVSKLDGPNGGWIIEDVKNGRFTSWEAVQSASAHTNSNPTNPIAL